MPDEPIVKPHRSRVEVRSEAGTFLFVYHDDLRIIEVRKRGKIYHVPVRDLVDFGRTSEREVFMVETLYPQAKDGEDVIRQGFE